MSKSLVAKLAEVMSEIDHVEKKGKNTFHNYNYVKAADLANIVRQKMAARQIIMLSDVIDVRNYEITNQKEQKMYGVDLKVKYTFYDGESEAQVSFHGYGSGLDSGDKGAYKAHTGALKYALRNAFLVPDEKGDPESDEKVDTATAPKAKPDPQPLIGIIKSVKVRTVTDNPTIGDPIGEGHNEVWVEIQDSKKVLHVCMTGSEPNMSKLLDAEGQSVELLVLPTGKLTKDERPIYSIHVVMPLPLEKALTESVKDSKKLVKV
jgi:ERF superfamily